MLIAVINEGSRVSNVEVQRMCKAVEKQLRLHVAPAWNQKAPSVKFYTTKTRVPGYAWVVNIVDSPNVAGALGYHSEDNNLIDAFIFCNPILDNGGAVFDASNPAGASVSSVLSHELCEMFMDRFANCWVDGPSLPQGSEYAMELCDPVEGNSYMIDGISVSNFIFPSWTNIQAKVPENMPLDYMKELSAPFTMSKGGYMIVRKNGKVNQVFGDHMPHWKRELKKSEWYRR